MNNLIHNVANMVPALYHALPITLLVVIAAMSILLRWFVRLTPACRRDVIELVRALRKR